MLRTPLWLFGLLVAMAKTGRYVRAGLADRAGDGLARLGLDLPRSGALPLGGTPRTGPAMTKPPLTLYLAAPRGFCAGVDRAVKIVEMAMQKWGAPVYVRHEIVHNRFVVEGLRAKGAVFVEELDECPDDRPVIFSAHGVPKSVPAAAAARGMMYVDATCPLVSKVHAEAARHSDEGLQMVMIGHAGHPEVLGTMGQLPPGEVLLVETVADVARLAPRDPARLAYITQTTLSVDDTAAVIAALAGALSRHRRPGARKTSAMPPPTGRRRCARSRQRSPRCW